MLGLTTAEGMPVAWCLASPKLGEREVAQEWLAQAREDATLRPGVVVVTDKGLSGKGMEAYCTEQVGVLLVRPDRRDEKRRFGNLAGIRQWIESVNDTLKGRRKQAAFLAPAHRKLRTAHDRLYRAQLRCPGDKYLPKVLHRAPLPPIS